MQFKITNNLFESDFREVYNNASNKGVLNSYELNYKDIKNGSKKYLCFYLNNSPVAILLYERLKFHLGFYKLRMGDKFGTIPLIKNVHQYNKSLLNIIAETINNLSNIKDALTTIFLPNNKLLYLILKEKGFGIKENYSCILDLENKGEDTILKKLNKKCRNSIKKAYKNELIAKLESDFSKFYNLCKNKEYLDLDKIKKELISYRGYSDFLNIYKSKKVVTSSMILKFHNDIKLKYLVSSNQGYKLCSNNLLIWEMIKIYKNKKIDLGGLGHEIYNKVSGYGRFKLSFSPDVIYRPYMVKYNKFLFPFKLIKNLF